MELERAIIQSCDVFFYQTGLKLGVDRLAQYANMFGLGERRNRAPGGTPRAHPDFLWKKQATGVPWQRGETISISIGQGFDLTTPLQMAMGYAAIANNGKLWHPYVVKRIEGSTGDEIGEIKPRLKRKIPIEQRYFGPREKRLARRCGRRQGNGPRREGPFLPDGRENGYRAGRARCAGGQPQAFGKN